MSAAKGWIQIWDRCLLFRINFIRLSRKYSHPPALRLPVILHISFTVETDIQYASDISNFINSRLTIDDISYAKAHTLKREYRHCDGIFITGCTGSCQSDNFQYSRWWKCHPNDDISVSVYNVYRESIKLIGHQFSINLFHSSWPRDAIWPHNIRSGNGFMPDDTKPLSESILTNHHEMMWHSPVGNLRGNAQDISRWYKFQN